MLSNLLMKNESDRETEFTYRYVGEVQYGLPTQSTKETGVDRMIRDPENDLTRRFASLVRELSRSDPCSRKEAFWKIFLLQMDVQKSNQTKF